jgi:hypothetical protein
VYGAMRHAQLGSANHNHSMIAAIVSIAWWFSPRSSSRVATCRYCFRRLISRSKALVSWR